MVKRPCPKRGCPTLITKSQRYCPTHEAEAEAARGTTTQRGYGATHKALRAQWRARIDRGGVTCARCHKPLVKGAPFDLGHDDKDRSKYNGPEHVSCNRSAGGRSASRPPR